MIMTNSTLCDEGMYEAHSASSAGSLIGNFLTRIYNLSSTVEGSLVAAQRHQQSRNGTLVSTNMLPAGADAARLYLLFLALPLLKCSLIFVITNTHSWTPCTKGWVSLTLWYMYITYFIQVCVFLSLPFACWGSNSGTCICNYVYTIT